MNKTVKVISTGLIAITIVYSGRYFFEKGRTPKDKAINTGMSLNLSVNENQPTKIKALSLTEELDIDLIDSITIKPNLYQSPSLILPKTKLLAYKSEKGQVFQINPIKDTVIFGEQGTGIYIPANAFESKGLPIQSRVHFELKEYYKLVDFLKSGLATLSGKNILKTAGSFYISAKSEGQELTLAKDKKIELFVPVDSAIYNMEKYKSTNGKNWVTVRKKKFIESYENSYCLDCDLYEYDLTTYHLMQIDSGTIEVEIDFMEDELYRIKLNPKLYVGAEYMTADNPDLKRLMDTILNQYHSIDNWIPPGQRHENFIYEVKKKVVGEMELTKLVASHPKDFRQEFHGLIQTSKYDPNYNDMKLFYQLKDKAYNENVLSYVPPEKVKSFLKTKVKDGLDEGDIKELYIRGFLFFPSADLGFLNCDALIGMGGGINIITRKKIPLIAESNFKHQYIVLNDSKSILVPFKNTKGQSFKNIKAGTKCTYIGWDDSEGELLYCLEQLIVGSNSKLSLYFSKTSQDNLDAVLAKLDLSLDAW